MAGVGGIFMYLLVSFYLHVFPFIFNIHHLYTLSTTTCVDITRFITLALNTRPFELIV